MSIAQTIRFAVNAHRLSRVARKSPHHVEQLREPRLRRLLQVAATAPFFREKYRGIDLERCQLSDLPITRKHDLMSRFDDAVTDRTVRRADVEQFLQDPGNLGRFFRGRYAVSHTSGSQGQPLLLIQDRGCLELLFGIAATRATALGKIGLKEGLRRLARPARMAVVTMKRGFYPSGSAFEFMPAVVGPFVRMTRLSAMQPDLIDRLNQVRPNVVVAYPSVLEWLALQPGRLRLSPHLHQLGSTGECLTERVRLRLQQAFGVPIFDHYGIGECLFLTEGCPTDGGAHVNADWAILEVVDKAGRPVPAGQPGDKILVTNLANTVQPIIRYEVGDVLTLADRPCRCGSRLPWIERIDGRASDVFWIGENKDQMVAGLVFKHGVEYLHEIRDWQAVQVERHRVEMRIALLPGAELDEPTAERVVVRKLEELGMPRQVRVNVRIVPALSPDPVTGKFRRMISQVDAA